MRSFCCSFVAPRSPEYVIPKPAKEENAVSMGSKCFTQNVSSFSNSPSPNTKPGLGFIGPRRILSPGRVSPIDSEPLADYPTDVTVEVVQVAESEAELKSDLPEKCISSRLTVMPVNTCGSLLSVRLDLKGKNGARMLLELNSDVLCKNSPYFAEKMADARDSSCFLIEIADIDDLVVLKEAIELMYDKDITRKLIKLGVSRSISILEVSYTIMFKHGISSCLSYLEAVPWSDAEEDRLRYLFTKCKFEGQSAQEILARMCQQESTARPPLALDFISSVTRGINPTTSRELKALVKSMLFPSFFYEKDPASLTKEALYSTCNSCISVLLQLFQQATGLIQDPIGSEGKDLTLIGRISKKVEDINWLLEILTEMQIGEDFVGLWGRQNELVGLHEKSSPIVRYELSRISGHVFIALGKGKLQCRTEERSIIFQAWFGPMLVDFGWLQRCSKGLNLRELEEMMGQALLTLPLNQQHYLFIEWVGCYSKSGAECPNLTGAFQVWWRRTFTRGARGAAEP